VSGQWYCSPEKHLQACFCAMNRADIDVAVGKLTKVADSATQCPVFLTGAFNIISRRKSANTTSSHTSRGRVQFIVSYPLKTRTSLTRAVQKFPQRYRCARVRPYAFRSAHNLRPRIAINSQGVHQKTGRKRGLATLKTFQRKPVLVAAWDVESISSRVPRGTHVLV
jgi:hypothetical protein